MLHELLHYDLTSFDVRKVPYTDALQEQMLISLDPINRWWLEELQSGRIWSKKMPINGKNNKELLLHAIECDTIQQQCALACSEVSANRRTQTRLGIFLKKALPIGWPQKASREKMGRIEGETKYYLMPPLEEARNHFEKITGLIGVFSEY